MISNIIPCCRKYLPLNENLFLEVRNNCSYFLYMSIEYDINHRVIRKQSPVFGPGSFSRLTFSSSASLLYLRIFNCSQIPPETICSQFIKNHMSSCYNVTGNSPSSLSFIEVSC